MIEMRQLRYFVRVVELGSMSRAANDLHTVTSALSQQISKLEGEISTRLLERTTRGVMPTAAGLEFYREAQLSLRHADQAASVAQLARKAGRVSIGLAPSTANILGTPVLRSMLKRYPEVQVHLLEAPTGYLSSLLNARQLDLAILFDIDAGWRWHVRQIATEKVYLIERLGDKPVIEGIGPITIDKLANVRLILPSHNTGLRRAIDASFKRAGVKCVVAAEADSLSIVLEAIDAGHGATLQSWSAIAQVPNPEQRFRLTELDGLVRVNSLCCLSEDELTAPAIGARLVIMECAQELIGSGRWLGATSDLPDR